MHKSKFVPIFIFVSLLTAIPLCSTQSVSAQNSGHNTWDLRGGWLLEVGWFQWNLSDPLGSCRVDSSRGILQTPVSFTQDGNRVIANASVAGDSNGTVIGNGVISGNNFESSESDGLRWVGTITRTIDGNGGAITQIAGTEYCGQANLPFTITRLDPTPYPPENLGSLDYYRFRFNDFVRRNPDLQPPDYYLEFGEKNLMMFVSETRPKLTAQGQQFLDTVKQDLQRRIENVLNANPESFSELEKKSYLFRQVAFLTHIEAYCDAGWESLPQQDRDTIIGDVDWLDKYNPLQVGGVTSGFLITYSCGTWRDLIPNWVPSWAELRNSWSDLIDSIF